MKRPLSRSIEDLYPGATPEQLEDAQERLQSYAQLLLRIVDHVREDPDRCQRFKAALTAADQAESPDI